MQPVFYLNRSIPYLSVRHLFLNLCEGISRLGETAESINAKHHQTHTNKLLPSVWDTVIQSIKNMYTVLRILSKRMWKLLGSLMVMFREWEDMKRLPGERKIVRHPLLMIKKETSGTSYFYYGYVRYGYLVSTSFEIFFLFLPRKIRSFEVFLRILWNRWSLSACFISRNSIHQNIRGSIAVCFVSVGQLVLHLFIHVYKPSMSTLTR